MLRLLGLGAACHQITFIVVESWLFKGLREWAQARSEHLGKLLSCHLCFGTWVGLLLAALFRPRVAQASPVLPGPLRAIAMWAVDGFVIALVSRVLNESIATVRKEVEVKEREAEVMKKEAERLDASAEQEPERLR